MFCLFAIEKSETVFSFFEKEPPFIVSWSHYLQLMRIENEAERSFYEIETAKMGWGVRTLQRQYNSSLPITSRKRRSNIPKHVSIGSSR